MVRVFPTAPPEGSLIAPFVDRPGHYSDAFAAGIAAGSTLRDAIAAFYTTPLFRAERTLLSIVGMGGTAADLSRLADGTGDRFAAWRVEARRESEILLADVSGRTKSWLSVVPGASGTLLQFGSVIVPKDGLGPPVRGPVLACLIGPHRVYSRALLAAAARRLTQGDHGLKPPSRPP